MRQSHSTQAQSTASHCRLTSLMGEWLLTNAQQGLLWLATKLHHGHATGSRDIQNGWLLSGQPSCFIILHVILCKTRRAAFGVPAGHYFSNTTQCITKIGIAVKMPTNHGIRSALHKRNQITVVYLHQARRCILYCTPILCCPLASLVIRACSLMNAVNYIRSTGSNGTGWWILSDVWTKETCTFICINYLPL